MKQNSTICLWSLQFLIYVIVLTSDLSVLSVLPFFKNIERLLDTQTWRVSEEMFPFGDRKIVEMCNHFREFLEKSDYSLKEVLF